MITPLTFRQLDEFLRLYQVGFVAVWPLLGLAAVDGWTAGSVAGLLAVSVCFNLVGGVLNDICDLESDRRCPERFDRWLVMGVVSVRRARVLVIAQVPIMLALHLAAGFRFASLGWLAAAVAGEVLYDIFGKKSRVPPIAEAGQGLAAGSLVCYGAACTSGTIPDLAWLAAAAGVAMLMLANAFHGGLRDLHDDLQSNVETTPIWLGCSGTLDRVRISAAMSAYGGWWLAVLLAVAVAIAQRGSLTTMLATLAWCAINVALFVALHRLRNPAWRVAVRLHVGLLMVPVMTAFTDVMSAGATAVLAGIYLAPVVPLTWWRMRTPLLRRDYAVVPRRDILRA